MLLLPSYWAYSAPSWTTWQVSPIDSTDCLADIDYLVLSVTLSEPDRDHLYVQGPAFLSLGPLEPTLLVTASANLVRVWTCANALQLLAELGAGFAGAAEQEVTTEISDIDITLGQQIKDMLPYLEDAMVELTEKTTYITEKEKPKVLLQDLELKCFTSQWSR